MKRTAWTLVLVSILAAAAAAGPAMSPPVPRDPTDAVAVEGMVEADRVNLERNLRWMLHHERETRGWRNRQSPPFRVGLYADAGAWHEGMTSIAAALGRAGVEVRALDFSLLSQDGLVGLDALVLPGGWAPFQRDAAGPEGLAAVKTFVEGGGRCLGICAGAYLLSRSVRWEGTDFPYPLGLFDGTAEGPVKGLAPWPTRGGVRLGLTEAGRKKGLGAIPAEEVLYFGGGSFRGGTGTVVLATYPDGSAAVVERKVGKGAIVLSGVHFERPPPPGKEGELMPKEAGEILRALLSR